MKKLVGGGIAALVLLCACGPTVEEAAREFLPVYCQKLKDCTGGAFDAAFPSIDACVDKGLSGFSDDDKKKRSACDDAEIQTCNDDIKATDCSKVNSFDVKQLPASCQKC